jgi:hypothetical protein
MLRIMDDYADTSLKIKFILETAPQLAMLIQPGIGFSTTC